MSAGGQRKFNWGSGQIWRNWGGYPEEMRVNLRQTAVLTSERASPGGPMGKESTCNAGDTEDVGSVSGLGSSHGGGHGNPL